MAELIGFVLAILIYLWLSGVFSGENQNNQKFGDVKIYSQKEIIAFLETVHFDVTCYEHTNSSSYIVIAKKEF